MVVGMYRAYVEATEDSIYFIKLGTEIKQAYIVKYKEQCEGMTLKFLDNNGMYRFISCNKFYETKTSPKLLGIVNNFVISLSDFGKTKNVGYTSDKIYSLVYESQNDYDLDLIKDLYISPMVYLLIGEIWVAVDIKGDNINKTRKKSIRTINLEATIKDINTITLL
jgi:hypothetical protein